MKKQGLLKRGCLALAFLFSLGLATSKPDIRQDAETKTAVAQSSIDRSLPAVPDKGAQPDGSDFVLLYGTQAADLFAGSDDYEGVEIALNALAGDIELVGGEKPEVKDDTSQLSNMAVIAGTIGKSAVINTLISTSKINVSNVTGKWESYQISIVENPVAGVDRALVIAGSDKRGTIYGIYKISELIGVSPWVYWADSYPVRSGKLTFASNFSVTQGEPSVKYRGIFLNDEAPGLSTWVADNFKGALANSSASKGYNHEFYSKVFELILRLKGNYLWPAMWNNSFNTDDLLNPQTADKYGVVMGTSHQEHMTCADKEWTWANKGAWNYNTNKTNVYDFWQSGVEARKEYETVLTLGMRGQEDTSILGPDATLADNINLLQGVIYDQRIIVKDSYGAADAAPQVLALYKEVENFYYGDGTVTPLNVPSDVTLLICDDNFGNVRALPTAEMVANREGGFGMYYHFDYRGGPISYEWINQTPLTKVWEQMTTAYDAGVQQMWIVNVGDLKPMELPIDYFLNLAYDYDEWSPVNKVDEFTRAFTAREFGAAAADDAADALNVYTKITGARKAEVVNSNPSTFSLTKFDEADKIISEFEAAVLKAERAYNSIPDYRKDAFFQLVLYPARASLNTYKTQVYAAWSNFMAREGLPVANEYAELSKKAFDADAADTEYYNKEAANGKWDGIMRQNHMGYTAWDSASTSVTANKMPTTGSVTAEVGSSLAIRLQNSSTIVRSGSATLDNFTNLAKENRYIDIFNGKSIPFAFTVSSDKDWLKVSKTEDIVINQTRVGMSVDFTKVSSDSSAVITVTGAGTSINVNVSVKFFAPSLDEKTYVETDGYVSINPKNYSINSPFSGQSFGVINDYGRDGDSVKVLQNGKYYTVDSDAPYLEYKFYIQTAGTYSVNTFIAPSINAKHKSFTPVEQQLRFSTQIDNGARITKSGLPATFEPGVYSPPDWQYGVVNNTRLVTTANNASLSAGLHTLRIYAVDPNVVIQKIIISSSSSIQSNVSSAPLTYHFMNSYLGPNESYYKGTQGISSAFVPLDSQIKQFGASDVEVTFKLSNGTVLGTATALAANSSKLTSAQIAAITPPSRTDYVFKGWIIADTDIYISAETVFVLPTTLVASYVLEEIDDTTPGDTGTPEKEGLKPWVYVVIFVPIGIILASAAVFALFKIKKRKKTL